MDKKKPFTQLNIDALKALRCLSGSSILVYVSLRIYGGKDSTAWPSQDRISKDLDMPIATVRKAFAQLRKAEFIKAKDGARTKTTTYQIVDANIPNMVCQQNTEDTNSDIPTYQIGYLDIPDRISADTKTDIQIDKAKDKKNIQLIHKASVEPQVQRKLQNNEFTLRGSIDRLSRTDLLFLKFWSLYSVRHGMRATGGNPIDDWQRAKSGASSYQIERSLKKMDLMMRQNVAPWRPLQGSKWITYFNRWFLKDPDRPLTAKEEKGFAGGVDVDLIEYSQHKEEQMKAEEANERAQAIALQPTTAARGLWREFRLNNQEWPELVDAVQLWKKTFLTEELRAEIQEDPDLEDFAMIININ